MPQTQKQKLEITTHPKRGRHRMTAGPVVSQTGDLGSGGGLQSHEVGNWLLPSKTHSRPFFFFFINRGNFLQVSSNDEKSNSL